MSDVDYNLQGQNGGKVLGVSDNVFSAVDDNGGRSGRGLLIVNDAVLDAYVGNLVNSAELIGITIPAGMYIPGAVTSVDRASGVVIVPF